MNRRVTKKKFRQGLVELIGNFRIGSLRCYNLPSENLFVTRSRLFGIESKTVQFERVAYLYKLLYHQKPLRRRLRFSEFSRQIETAVDDWSSLS